MSKRWGNIINPLDVISQYGADTLRMYEMFMGPLDQMKAWNVESVAGVYRFLCRVWTNAHRVIEVHSSISDHTIEVALHKTIKKVTEDIPEMKFNTGIAAMMEFINIWEKEGTEKLSESDLEKFLLILAPYAPFSTEELWSQLHAESIHMQAWPTYDATKLVSDTVDIPVQVNGKVRAKITVPTVELGDEARVIALARAQEGVVKFLTGEPKKVIYVHGRILNLIG
jgi:leucyl-tRNA synthetase